MEKKGASKSKKIKKEGRKRMKGGNKEKIFNKETKGKQKLKKQGWIARQVGEVTKE